MAYGIDTLSSSYKKTKKLFFPIKKGYWLRMGLINLFGGRGASNMSGNSFSGSDAQNRNLAELIHNYGPILGIIFVFFTLLSLLFVYINSVFTFIFIEGVTTRKIGVKKSFRKNKSLGLNMFFVRLITGLITLVLMLAIASPAIYSFFNDGFADFNYLWIIPMLLGFFLMIFALTIFWFLVYDFVMPVMYFRKYNFRKAWGYFIRSARKNKGEIALYWLVKAVLSIILNLVTIILAVVIMILFGIVLAVIGAFVLWLFSLISQTIGLAVMWVYVALALIFLLYVMSVILVPIPAFLRVWSIEMTKKIVKL